MTSHLCAVLMCGNTTDTDLRMGWSVVPRYAPSSAWYPVWHDHFCPDHKDVAR